MVTRTNTYSGKSADAGSLSLTISSVTVASGEGMVAFAYFMNGSSGPAGPYNLNWNGAGNVAANYTVLSADSSWLCAVWLLPTPTAGTGSVVISCSSSDVPFNHIGAHVHTVSGHDTTTMLRASTQNTLGGGGGGSNTNCQITTGANSAVNDLVMYGLAARSANDASWAFNGGEVYSNALNAATYWGNGANVFWGGSATKNGAASTITIGATGDVFGYAGIIVSIQNDGSGGGADDGLQDNLDSKFEYDLTFIPDSYQEAVLIENPSVPFDEGIRHEIFSEVVIIEGDYLDFTRPLLEDILLDDGQNAIFIPAQEPELDPDYVSFIETGIVGDGDPNISGTMAVTLTGVTQSASGLVTVTGTIASTLSGVTMAFSGLNNVTGTFASTLTGATMAFQGAVIVTGTMAATLSGVTMSGTGFSGSVTGTLVTTLTGITMSFRQTSRNQSLFLQPGAVYVLTIDRVEDSRSIPG